MRRAAGPKAREGWGPAYRHVQAGSIPGARARIKEEPDLRNDLTVGAFRDLINVISIIGELGLIQARRARGNLAKEAKLAEMKNKVQMVKKEEVPAKAEKEAANVKIEPKVHVGNTKLPKKQQKRKRVILTQDHPKVKDELSVPLSGGVGYIGF